MSVPDTGTLDDLVTALRELRTAIVAVADSFEEGDVSFAQHQQALGQACITVDDITKLAERVAAKSRAA